MRTRLSERVEGGAFRCAFAPDGELVGVAAAYDLELTVPGPAPLRVSGWSEIAVLPTYRRRGVLRALVARLVAEAAAHGRPAVVLFASEGGIYGRFGFAPACFAARYRLDLARAALRDGGRGPGRVLLLRADEARGALPAVFDLARRARPGEIDRGSSAWADLLEDAPRVGGGARFVVAYEQDGRIDGYAVYDVGPDPATGGTGRTVSLVELVGLHPVADRALWAHLLGTDLVENLVTAERPVDEPLRHLLADPRALRTTAVDDHLWLRLLDPAAALAARRYGASGVLVLEVAVPDAPPARLALEVDEQGGPAVTPSRAPADLRLDAAALAACYLGGTTFGALAAAGRVAEVRPGALRHADGLFATAPAPFCTADV